MINLKLSYFELLSPEPIQMQGVGGILSPTLRDISKIGINTYHHYLNVLSMNLKTYFSMIQQEEVFEILSDNEKAHLSVFEFLTMDDESAESLRDILNFFISEDVVWHKQTNCFLVNKKNIVKETGIQTEKESTIGVITKETYPQICDLICQRNCVKSNLEDDTSKVKSKKAMEIMKKLQKGRKEKAKTNKKDENMELGNIISSVANKSHSLNIANIWDLTVYQVWDCFLRISNNNIYDIQSMSVAAYGNKDNFFDATAWFKRIDTTN